MVTAGIPQKEGGLFPRSTAKTHMIIDNKFGACIGQPSKQRLIIFPSHHDAKMRRWDVMTLNLVGSTTGISSIHLRGIHLMGDQLVAEKVKVDPAC